MNKNNKEKLNKSLLRLKKRQQLMQKLAKELRSNIKKRKKQKNNINI